MYVMSCKLKKCRIAILIIFLKSVIKFIYTYLFNSNENSLKFKYALHILDCYFEVLQVI